MKPTIPSTSGSQPPSSLLVDAAVVVAGRIAFGSEGPTVGSPLQQGQRVAETGIVSAHQGQSRVVAAAGSAGGGGGGGGGGAATSTTGTAGAGLLPGYGA
jgi:hypothetical protein